MIRHHVFSEAAASADGTDGQCTEHGYEHLLGSTHGKEKDRGRSRGQDTRRPEAGISLASLFIYCRPVFHFAAMSASSQS
jgi:hypothetical protein